MGYGDFKLFAAIGAWLGWQMLPLVLLLAAVGRRGRRHRDDGGAAGSAAACRFRSGPTSRAPPGSRMLWGPGHRRALSRFRGPRLIAMLRIGLTGGIASGKIDRCGPLRRARRDRDRHRRDRARGRRARPARARRARQRAGRRHPRRRRAGSIARSCAGACSRTRRRAATVEAILHPAILAELERQARQAAGPYQIFVIPLLVEDRLEQVVDRVLVVDCPEEEQLRRLQARDGESRGVGAADARGPGHRASSAWRRRTTSSTTAARRADLPAQVAALDLKYRGLAASP